MPRKITCSQCGLKKNTRRLYHRFSTTLGGKGYQKFMKFGYLCNACGIIVFDLGTKEEGIIYRR